MAIEAAHPIVENNARSNLTKLVYAVLFLVLTDVCFIILSGKYIHHLVTTGQYRLVWLAGEDAPLAQGLYYFLQLVILLSFFRPFRQIWRRPTDPRLAATSVYKRVTIGIIAALVALGATVPLYLGMQEQTPTALNFLAKHFDAVGVAYLLLVILVLPLLTELFFRRILLGTLMESISVVAALIVSILLFAVSWPVYSLLIALVFGLVVSLLFWKTRSVLSCAVANSCFMLGTILLQLWQAP
jgi:membrane protease YdiL (CAAX protease family)